MDDQQTDPEQPNLRERKQRLLRLELGEVALGLFNERGFDQTTIEDIAKAAGISRRTFFRYFETKEAVVLWRLRYRSEQLREALEARPSEEPPLLALRHALAVVHESMNQQRDKSRAYLQFLLKTPSLRAHFLDILEQWRLDVLPELTRRLGPRPDREEMARLAASVSIATQDVALRRWVAEGSTRELKEYVDEAFSALGELVRALPLGPSSP